MFGALVDDEGGWARFAARRIVSSARFRDVDWGAVITAGANLTAAVVTTAVKASQGSAQPNQPQSYQCPQGYVFDAPSGMCLPYQQQGGGFNIDPTTIAVVGLLAVVLLTGKGG